MRQRDGDAMRVRYRVLGELAIDVDDERVEIGGGLWRAILAGLLINANRQLSMTELMRVGWGRDDIDITQVHKRAKTVRDLLRRIGRADQLVNHRGGGYELRIPSDELDLLQFNHHVLRAEAAKAGGQVEDEIAHRRMALAFWAGSHVVSNVDEKSLRAMAHDIEQRRKRTAIRLAELEFARNNHQVVLAELSALNGYLPADRRLCELLMVAQYRAGHPADASVTLERYREALETETGGAVEAALRDLNYAISRGDDSEVRRYEAVLVAGTSLASRRGGVVPTLAIPHQLPAAPADFVGRADLVAEATWLLRRSPAAAPPVIVVSAPGGMGKTALALRVAHQVAAGYEGGQLFAELHGGSNNPAGADEVIAGFLRALGVAQVPEAAADRTSLYRTLLADRPVLVVLDDAASEEQVRPLVPGNPACAVIVTARQRLPDLGGAHHIAQLTPLGPETATGLFRSVVTRAGIGLGPDSPDLERLVALCAGLPLALRIVASMFVRDHPRSLSALADQLARHGAEAIEYGPRSLARTIGAGFDQLDADGQRLLLGLALTNLPEFELWTAAAVLDGTGADPRAALSQLASRYIVEPTAADHRYRFHDLTRDYAQRRGLREIPDGEIRRLIETTYRALLTLARHGHRRLSGGDFEVVHADLPDWELAAGVGVGPDYGAARAWFERERANIRAAVERCETYGLSELSWDLALSTHEFYAMARYFDDWQATHTTAIRVCRAVGDRRGEALLVGSMGQPALVASRRKGSRIGPVELERALETLEQLGDRHGQAILERTLANALRRRGQLARPLVLFTQALEHYEASGDTLGQWQTLRFIGQTHLDRGELQAALRLLGQAREVAIELGTAYSLAQTSYWMGKAHLDNGDIPAARSAFEVVLGVFGTEGSGAGRAYAIHALGDIALRSQEMGEAAELLGQAANLAAQASDATLEGRVYLSLAELHRVQSHDAAEAAALQRAAECFAGGDAAYYAMVALTALSHTEARRGDRDAADRAWARVLHLYHTMDLPAEDRIHRPPPALPDA